MKREQETDSIVARKKIYFAVGGRDVLRFGGPYHHLQRRRAGPMCPDHGHACLLRICLSCPPHLSWWRGWGKALADGLERLSSSSSVLSRRGQTECRLCRPPCRRDGRHHHRHHPLAESTWLRSGWLAMTLVDEISTKAANPPRRTRTQKSTPVPPWVSETWAFWAACRQRGRANE